MTPAFPHVRHMLSLDGVLISSGCASQSIRLSALHADVTVTPLHVSFPPLNDCSAGTAMLGFLGYKSKLGSEADQTNCSP